MLKLIADARDPRVNLYQSSCSKFSRAAPLERKARALGPITRDRRTSKTARGARAANLYSISK